MDKILICSVLIVTVLAIVMRVQRDAASEERDQALAMLDNERKLTLRLEAEAASLRDAIKVREAALSKAEEDAAQARKRYASVVRTDKASADWADVELPEKIRIMMRGERAE